MKTSKYQFLQSLLGEGGISALAKAAARSSEIESILFPRTALAWVEFFGEIGDYTGPIPGQDMGQMTLSKGEAGYCGSIDLVDQQVTYSFENSTADHVVAALALSLGCDDECLLDLRHTPVQLQQLGKTLDLLVQAQVCAGALSKTQDQSGEKPGEAQAPTGQVGPGSADAPESPSRGLQDEKPRLPRGDIGVRPRLPSERGSGRTVEPVVPVTATQAAVPQRSRPLRTSEPAPDEGSPRQVPRLAKPRARRLQLSETQRGGLCKACQRPLFEGGTLACLCFRDLAKGATLDATGALYLDPTVWDDDALLALVDSIRGEQDE